MTINKKSKIAIRCIFFFLILSLLIYSSSVLSGELTEKDMPSPITNYTPNTKTECLNNVCNILIYPSTKFIKEDNKWIDVKDAKSLKGFFKVIIKEDKDFPVEVIDFNYTSITLKLDSIPKNILSEVPIRIFNNENASKFSSESSSTYMGLSKDVTLDLSKIKDQNILNTEFKWGFNSTEIIIQSNQTGNLADAQVYQEDSSGTYGTTDTLDVQSWSSAGFTHRSYLKFNISNIPSGSTINNAYLGLYKYADFAGLSINVNLHHVFNDSWSESSVSWNNQPCGTSFNISSSCNLTNESNAVSNSTNNIWYNFNVSNSIAWALNNSSKNVSFAIKRNTEPTNQARYVQFYSKNYNTDISLRPYLNITYTTGSVDTSYPIFSAYQDNNGSLNNSGIGLFNVTVNNTNGTVWIEINNTNITATNLSMDIYNITYNFTSNGTYAYRWYAYGNGTSKLFNSSELRYYTVNYTSSQKIINLTWVHPIVNINATKNQFFNITLNVTCVQGNCGEINISLDPIIEENVNRNKGILIVSDVTASYPIPVEPRQIAYCNNQYWIAITNSTASGNTLYLFNSSDNGTTWQNRTYNSPIGRDTIDCFGQNIFIAFNDYTTNYLALMKSLDNGETFTYSNISTQYSDSTMMINLEVINSTSFYILASNGSKNLVLHRSDDNGLNIKNTSLSVDEMIGLVSPYVAKLFVNGDNVLALIQNSSKSFITYKSTDGGLTFGSRTLAYLTPNVDQTDSVWGISKGSNIYLTGGDYGNPADGNASCLFESNDFGDSWLSQNCINLTDQSVGLVDGTLTLDNATEDIYTIAEYQDGLGTPSSSDDLFQIILLKYNGTWNIIKNITNKTGYAPDNRYYMPHSSKYLNNGYFDFLTTNENTNNVTYISYYIGYSSSSKGLIPMNTGTPFYTNTTNPYNITLNQGESSLINFWVNATGNLATYEFYAYANLTNNMSNSIITNKTNITIISAPTSPDTTNPTWTSIPANSSQIYNTVIGIDFDATDETALSKYFTNDTRFNMYDNGTLYNTSIIAVGEYVINVSANDTSGNNVSLDYYLNITKATPICLFTKNSPQIYPNQIMVNGSCIGDIISPTEIYRNGSNKTSENATYITLGVGTYNYTINISSSQNYTYYENSTIVSIFKNNNTCDVSYNETSPIIYPLRFKAYSNCSSSFNISKNGTQIINNSEQFLSAGTYNYTVERDDNENYTFFYNSSLFIINKNNDGCNISFNTTSPQTHPISFRAYTDNCTAYQLYRNGTVIENNSVQDLAVGTWNFTIYRNDTENYTNIAETKEFTITQGIGLVYTYINYSRANKSIIQNDSIYINGSLISGSGDILVYKNDTLIYNGSSPSSNYTNFTSLGLFNITTYYYGNENYTSSNETWYVNVSFISCVENLTNGTGWSDWYDYGCAGDYRNYTRNITQYDSSYCGYTANVTYYEEQLNRTLTNTSWSSWYNTSSCLTNDTVQKAQNLTQYNSYYCGANTTYYNYSYDSCDYCTPSLANTSGVTTNTSSCYYNDTITNKTTWTEYDSNYCGEVGNTTYSTYGYTTCGYAPTITIVYPTATTYNTNISGLNFTILDANLSYCWYNWNGTNSTPDLSCNNASMAITNGTGTYNWYVYANDTLNTFSYKNITFIVAETSSTPALGGGGGGGFYCQKTQDCIDKYNYSYYCYSRKCLFNKTMSKEISYDTEGFFTCYNFIQNNNTCFYYNGTECFSGCKEGFLCDKSTFKCFLKNVTIYELPFNLDKTINIPKKIYKIPSWVIGLATLSLLSISTLLFIRFRKSEKIYLK